MPEIDKTYTFKALAPEERARIATQKLEQMERDFFAAQVDFSIRKASIDPQDTAALTALDDEKKSIMAEHKKRLKAANTIFDEVKIAPPAPPA